MCIRDSAWPAWEEITQRLVMDSLFADGWAWSWLPWWGWDAFWDRLAFASAYLTDSPAKNGTVTL